MSARSKRVRSFREKIDRDTLRSIDEALGMVKELATAKFPESVDASVNLGVDPRKSDQVVRGSTVLPHGTGKQVRVAVFAQGAGAEAATEAGADLVGMDDLAEQVKKGEFALEGVALEGGAIAIQLETAVPGRQSPGPGLGDPLFVQFDRGPRQHGHGLAVAQVGFAPASPQKPQEPRQQPRQMRVVQSEIVIEIQGQQMHAPPQGRAGQRRDVAVAQDARVTRRGFFPRTAAVDQRHAVTPALQFERATDTDDAGAEHGATFHVCPATPCSSSPLESDGCAASCRSACDSRP